MTAEEVRRRVVAIDEIADMIEDAHMEEDRLYYDVLKAIAAGVDNPADLARAALRSRQLGLERHYSEAIPYDMR